MATKAAQYSTLSGVVAVVLVVLSFVVEGDTPALDAPADDVVAFYADNDAAVAVASVLATIAAVAFVFFAASLRRAIRRREDSAGFLSVVAFGGGVVFAAGIATDSAIRLALSESAGKIDPVALQSLFAFWDNFFWPMAAGLATLILATSLSAFETRVVPTWLAWPGFAIVVLMFTPIGEIALTAVAVWIFVVSALLWRDESTAGATGASATG